MRRFFLSLTFLFATGLSAQSPSSKGTEFWVAFMENLDLSGNGPPLFSMLLSSDVNTSGTLSVPVTGYTQSFNVTAGQATEVFFPTGVHYPTGSEFVHYTGFKVTTNDPVSLSVHHHRWYFSEASIVLPVEELGSEYLVMSHLDAGQYHPSEFIVAATTDNTVIDITPRALTIGLRPPGVAFSVTLNAGQVYQVQSMGDLTGSEIKARDGKKIAVYSGLLTGNIGCVGANDHLYDQDAPVPSWGMEFMVAPFNSPQGDFIRVLASENDTKVYWACDTVATLDRGEYFETLVSVPLRIASTHPVSVGQFKRSQTCSSLGDPSLQIHFPVSHVRTKAVFRPLVSAVPNSVFTEHYAHVFVKTAHVGQTLLDNVNIASSFAPVPAYPLYSFARLSLATGTHTLENDSGFYAHAFGFGSYDAYTHHLGYDRLAPPANAALSMAFSDSLCAGKDVQFNAGGGASSWSWTFGDGSGSTAQNPSHTYAAPGTYTVSLFALDANNCPLVQQRTISIPECTEEDCEIFVPSAFSPNGDNQNDLECVYGRCIDTIELSIYDRWGERVFFSADKNVCWDGRYKGELMNTGVFVYTLKATLRSGTEIRKSGSITLVR